MPGTLIDPRPAESGGAVHWAITMTLIQTAKLNGVNPMAYLTDVLERMVSGQTKRNELHTLLPWNWTASTSATITNIEQSTTVLVTDRPTPSVPPFVRMP